MILSHPEGADMLALILTFGIIAIASAMSGYIIAFRNLWADTWRSATLLLALFVGFGILTFGVALEADERLVFTSSSTVLKLVMIATMTPAHCIGIIVGCWRKLVQEQNHRIL